MLSFGREVKLWVPCRRFAARERTLTITWKSNRKGKIQSAIFPPSFPPSLTEGSARARAVRGSPMGAAWVPLELTEDTKHERRTKGPCNKGLSAYGSSRSQANLSIGNFLPAFRDNLLLPSFRGQRCTHFLYHPRKRSSPDKMGGTIEKKLVFLLRL
jgi:hypothetical protein